MESMSMLSETIDYGEKEENDGTIVKSSYDWALRHMKRTFISSCSFSSIHVSGVLRATTARRGVSQSVRLESDSNRRKLQNCRNLSSEITEESGFTADIWDRSIIRIVLYAL